MKEGVKDSEMEADLLRDGLEEPASSPDWNRVENENPSTVSQKVNYNSRSGINLTARALYFWI